MSLENTRRVFVALLPSAPAREAIAALSERMPRARWTPPGQTHLTLRFIGSVSEEELHKIRETLAKVRVAPFFLGVEGVGRFPPRGAPRVIWTGVGSGHPFLHRLRQQVDDRLLGAGVRFELTPFVPHFSVARVGAAPPVQVEHWLKRHRDFAGPVWRVDSFHLMASAPAADGAEYGEIAAFALRTD